MSKIAAGPERCVEENKERKRTDGVLSVLDVASSVAENFHSLVIKRYRIMSKDIFLPRLSDFRWRLLLEQLLVKICHLVNMFRISRPWGGGACGNGTHQRQCVQKDVTWLRSAL